MQLMSCPFNLSKSTNRILWEITSKCNMSCKHCLYYDSGNSMVHGEDCSTYEIFTIIDQIKGNAGVDQIWLSGGEPLIRKDIFQIIDKIKSSNIVPSISTNASLISVNTAEQLKTCGVDYVHVSIDGIDAHTHDSFRRYEGAYDKVIAAVDYLIHANIIVGATCTITNNNVDSINQLVKQSVDQGISVLSFYLIEPLGRGKELIASADVFLMKKLSESFERLYNEFGSQIKLELFRTSVSPDEEYLQDCLGEKFLSITSDGRLGTCPWFMKSNTQLLSQPIKNIGFSKAKVEVQQNMREYLNKRLSVLAMCVECSKNISCLKGCPAVSDQSQYDPLCSVIRR